MSPESGTLYGSEVLDAVLDNPVWAALTGPHRGFAEFGPAGLAARYAPDTSPFSALADPQDPRAWADLAALAGPGQEVWVTGLLTPPPGWQTLVTVPGVQLDGRAVRAEAAPEAVVLGLGDVPEMLELVALTKPGPLLDRTVELGTYLGIRHDGRLVAMAGERMRPAGWSEISAVCTHPDHRGRGLAGRLIRAVAAAVRERGELPFLHAAAANTGAVRLYESMGFALRRSPLFLGLRTPGA
ncbi:GNAT family N-acetyltransferase [Streptomyces sp. NPDC058682]|uniref:GNAT family N-acetyltransferase n=1 Tax=unclassified Streptomyces TaxID=2593676 RepID=UPI00225015BC|nr:GNAT family N-acetyltransferase [Streptomyces sp. NBC_01214]MCX4802818.1 GNAT family N-acetyltransferase [Streptomyces sp. NBC_01214]